MKLGLVSAILDGWTYEEMIDEISKIGYECVEVACWPRGKGERRYAGVSHIDVTDLDEKKKEHILSYAKAHGITISALAYYPNPLDPNKEKQKATIEHIYKVIDAAAFLDINLVTTFIGRDQSKSVDENIDLAVKVWDPILKYAQEKGVKIGIENCPMLFGKDQWPGGQNIMTSPVIFRELFKRLPYDNFGLNFDPSHFIWQQMDYVKAVKEFKDKLWHVHFKDIKLFKDKLAEYGTMAYPLDFMAPKLPGLGDVRWDEFVSALTEVGFDGYACIEVEDRAFEATKAKIIDSLKLSYKYMRNFVI